MLREARDYLGALTDVERVDRNTGRPLPGVTDAELAVMQVGFIFFVTQTPTPSGFAGARQETTTETGGKEGGRAGKGTQRRHITTHNATWLAL